VVQYSGGLLPWFVSIWVNEPWKLALWAVGVGLDLVLILIFVGHKVLDQFQARFMGQAVSRRRRMGYGRAMLRALREPGSVRNATRSPSMPIHTGTECGEPSGRTVAKCAWFASSQKGA